MADTEKKTVKKTTAKTETKKAVEKKTEKAEKAPAEKKTVAKKVEKEEVKAPVEKKAPAKGKTVKFAKFVQYTGTGRRKSSIARVRLVPNGKGNFVINDKHIDEYFGQGTLKQVAYQPLELTNTTTKFDVFVNVHGGGLTGQSGAIRHGIARALIKADESLRPDLKKAGFLERDSRAKERKKYGLKKARKAPQFRKR